MNEARAFQRIRRDRNKPPFLKGSEIRKLAAKLHTSPFVVATVLQVAGHVLRERYRRRGWIPAARGSGANHEHGVERQAVADAIEQVGWEKWH